MQTHNKFCFASLSQNLMEFSLINLLLFLNEFPTTRHHLNILKRETFERLTFLLTYLRENFFFNTVSDRNRKIIIELKLWNEYFTIRKWSQIECLSIGDINRRWQNKAKGNIGKKSSGINRKEHFFIYEQLIEPQLCYVSSLKHKQIVNRPIGLLILHEFNKSETEWDKRADRTG